MDKNLINFARAIYRLVLLGNKSWVVKTWNHSKLETGK